MPRRRIALLVGLGCSYVFFAVPVLRSHTERDPLNDFYTDHLRYRYCASLVVRSPIRAITTPLEEQYATDTYEHRALLWEKQPCHHAGLLHVAIHAPFQWALEGGLLAPHQATNLYVLLLLLLSHACLWLLLTGQHWWAGILLWPVLLRFALNAVQEPISFLLATLAAQAWVAGRRARALGLAVLVFSSYPRWILWIPPFAWLAWRERKEVVAQLRAVWAGRRGRTLAIAAAVVFAWSVFVTLMTGLSWAPPAGGTSPFGRAVLYVCAVLWIAYWGWDRRNELAPFMLTFTVFMIRFKSAFQYWYLAPMQALVPFARGRFEVVAWAVTAALLGEIVTGEHALATMDLWKFAVKAWVR